MIKTFSLKNGVYYIMQNIIILFFSILLFSCKNTAKKKEIIISDDLKLSITELADSLLLDPKINSLSIGIYGNGVKYTSHHGELDIGIGNKPTDKTIYEIASVSKTFTGVLAAKAVLEGKISLEEDIRNYLNEDFPNFEFSGKLIRIKDLLTHTSGLPTFLPLSINDLLTDFNESLPFKMYEIQKEYTKRNFLNDLHSIVLDTIPGLIYDYSNVDTELIAHILENVYKKSFDQILIEYFSQEANMPNTKINLNKSEEAQLANGYGMTNKLVPHEANSLSGADGGVKTTTSDIVNYMEFSLDTSNLVVRESQRVLYQKGKRKIAYYWPLRSSEDDGVYYRHHGGAFGSQNWFIIIPKYKIGVWVITNQSGLDTAGKLLTVANKILKEMK
jgi:CubicO group peptidase (beta-lactamase class C family)